MYEDNEQPVLRRVLLIIVWLVIIITIAWAVIWIAFFRQDNQTTSKNGVSHHTQSTSNTGDSKTRTQSSSSGSSTGSSSQSTTKTPSTDSTTPQPPQALANTGAGNVFIPFIAGSVVGTAAYYVYVRKKLTQ
jgi:cytoskeletal protein RodZ